MRELTTRFGRLACTASFRAVALGLLLLTALAAQAAPFAYITNTGGVSGTVSVIDTATNTVVTTIPTGRAFGVAVTPDGARVYIADGLSQVVVIDTATNTVLLPTIAVGGSPQGIAVTPDGTRVYVASTISDTVSVISTATNTVTATIPVGDEPLGVAITPDGARVYVVNRESDNVSVISTATNAVIDTVAVGDRPQGADVTPDGTRVYVTNQVTGNVSVIGTATNTVIATVAVGADPRGVAVTPDGTRVYVANRGSNNVSVISTASNSVTATVAVGTQPYGLAVTPDGARFYVANEGSNNVSVLDAATNTVIATVGVGSAPVALGKFIGGAAAPGVDTTPDPFAFTDVTGVALSTLIVSNSVTITGINAASPISVSGGEYSIGCSGTFATVAATISNGQNVCVRHTSAGTPGTATNTTLTVGGVSDTFTSTTAGPGVDTTPDPFAFIDVTGVALSTLITSSSVTITGITAAAPISVVGGDYSIGCSGTFTTAAGTISNGQTVCVRHTSAATASTATNTTLTVGGVSDTFTSTTAGVIPPPPPPLPPPPTEIPTLSQWALMVLALVLGMLGLARLRRVR